jgi:hypothetical protein
MSPWLVTAQSTGAPSMTQLCRGMGGKPRISIEVPFHQERSVALPPTQGAPSFSRILRKGWETPDANLDPGQLEAVL